MTASELATIDSPRELAFYGGTFTALEKHVQLSCLELAAPYKHKGLITKLRCSTRPDKVSVPLLRELRHAGLDMVELGVQTFNSEVLAASRPGYTEKIAVQACRMVKETGLDLAIQLMPGLPGMNEDIFRADMRHVLALAPQALRLYPCLVIEGTQLADLWRAGSYTPWSLERTIPLLTEAFIMTVDNAIQIIRMGLAPEPGLEKAILAGPRHPALGSIVRGRALYQRIQGYRNSLDSPPQAVRLPQRVQGEFWGHKGELREAYAALGITPAMVFWWDKDYCEFTG